jgi:hypothetical protein
MHGMFGVAMSEVVLHGAQVDTGIRQVVAARVPSVGGGVQQTKSER